MKNPICFLTLKHCNPSKRKLAISGINSNFLQEFNIPNNAITVGMFSALYRKKGVYEFATSLKK
ncbi:MAG: hypothetical protein ACTTJC_07520 [Campylobacter sp.]